MSFEWDVEKAEANLRKHRVSFPEAIPVLDDDYAIIATDDTSDPDELRYVALGLGGKQQPLVIVYCFRGNNIRIISARPAEPRERLQYEENR